MANVEPPQPDRYNPPDSQAGWAKGDGAFAAEESLPYDPPGTIVGQLKPDSCVAANCRMAIYDSTSSDLPESWIREAAKVEPGKGTAVKNAVNALARFGVASHYEERLSPEALKAATENGPVIVTVKTSTTAYEEHALMVDGFEGDYALIRDPLPEGIGAAYKVKTESFMRAWTWGREDGTGKAVIIEP